jgi:hypothetical protein
MTFQRSLSTVLALALLIGLSAGLAQAQGPDDNASPVPGAPQDNLTSGFTYQGMLKQNGAPINGVCEFQFFVYGDPTVIYAIDGPVERTAEVKNGLFTVTDIAFFPPVFNGERRWLGISVRCSPGEEFTTLEGRQELTAAPYALSLRPGAEVEGAVADSPYAVFTAENTDLGPNGKAIYGTSFHGTGGYFESYDGHALITRSASLLDGPNPKQIGMLRWYGINWSGYSMSVGATPDHIIFDGDHLWVSNYSAATVTKVRASDAAIVGTYAAGSNPNPLAFDGMYVWVGSENPSLGQNIVTKIRASDGETVKTLSIFNSSLPASRHWGMAFDGNWVWVSNTDEDSVTKIWAIDSMVVGTYPTGDAPHGVIFDGTYVWVANNGSQNLTKLRPSDGQVMGTCSIAGINPVGLAFDGAYVWATGSDPGNPSNGLLTVLRPSDCQIVTAYPVIGNPAFLAFDGYSMWVTHNRAGGLITRIRARDGHYTSDDIKNVGGNPLGIAFDGANIWVAESSTNTLSKH